MVLKGIGVVLLLLGTTAFGVYQAGRYMHRLNNLYEIQKAFRYIQGEIRYLQSPLTETLEGASYRVKGPCSRLFSKVACELAEKKGMEFQKVWRDTVRQEITAEVLDQEAREELLEMGSQLGCLDGMTQEKAIDYFLEKWEEIIRQRCQEKATRLKLYYVCGVTSGLLVVMVLI
nr:stage III sporulation protein AB [Eubacterium sp.]